MGLAAFGPLSTDLYLPALPAIVEAFGTDVASVQFTLSIFLFGFAAAQLVCGPLSDRFGRRPVLLGGLMLYVLASAACMMATNVDELVVARLFQATGACAGPVLGRAIVRDTYAPEEAGRVYAYLAMAMGLGPAIGPILGGYLISLFGWRASFVLLGGLGAFMLVIVFFYLSETNRLKDPHAISPTGLVRNYLHLLRSRDYLGYMVCSAGVFCGIFAFVSGSPFLLIDELGLSPTLFGLSFSAAVAGFMTGAFLAGRLSRRLGVNRLIEIGTLVCLTAGCSGVLFSALGWFSVATVIGPAALFLAGMGLVLPSAFAGAIAPFPAMAGLASALLGFVQMTAASLSGVLVGQLHNGTPMPMMTVIALTALVSALGYRLLVRRGTACPIP